MTHPSSKRCCVIFEYFTHISHSLGLLKEQLRLKSVTGSLSSYLRDKKPDAWCTFGIREAHVILWWMMFLIHVFILIYWFTIIFISTDTSMPLPLQFMLTMTPAHLHTLGNHIIFIYFNAPFCFIIIYPFYWSRVVCYTHRVYTGGDTMFWVVML